MWIFNAVASGIWSIVSWIFRTVVIKFVVLTVLATVVTELMSYVMGKFDFSPISSLQSTLGGIPSGVLFFLGLFRFDVGLPLMFGAMLTKFLIRRLPVIG